MTTFTIDRFSAKNDRIISGKVIQATNLRQAIALAVSWVSKLRAKDINLRLINHDNNRRTWVMIDNNHNYVGQHIIWCYFHDYEDKEQTLTFKI